MQIWSIWSLQSGTSTSSTHDAWKSRRSKQSTRCYCRLFAWLHSPPLWLLPNHALEDASVLAHSQFKGCVAPCSYRSTVWKCVKVIVSCQTIRVCIYIFMQSKRKYIRKSMGLFESSLGLATYILLPHNQSLFQYRQTSLFVHKKNSLSQPADCDKLRQLWHLEASQFSFVRAPKLPEMLWSLLLAASKAERNPKALTLYSTVADYPRYIEILSYWEKLT
jgi:hypothetical protein